jgi:hypothetical protein
MEVAVVKNGRPAAPRALQVGFWEGVRSGLGISEAGLAAGVGHEIAFRWFKRAGGVKSNGPRPASGRYLSLAEREEIAVGLAAGQSVRVIAAGLGRSPSTVSREVRRNSRGRRYYRALAAQGQAQCLDLGPSRLRRRDMHRTRSNPDSDPPRTDRARPSRLHAIPPPPPAARGAVAQAPPASRPLEAIQQLIRCRPQAAPRGWPDGQRGSP